MSERETVAVSATVATMAPTIVEEAPRVTIPTVEPVPRPDTDDLGAPVVPVVGDAIPRIRDTLKGIASTPRRRTTLIVIQGLACIFAASVFGYLILRRR